MKTIRPLLVATNIAVIILNLGLAGCGREPVEPTGAALPITLFEAKTLQGYTLNSRDGDIGKVKEFYFDDQHWTVRYLVADTGNWLTGQQVLISPYALGDVNREKHEIVVDLTKKQIEGSPPLESEKPVSRQFEDSYYGYYGMPMYWAGSNRWGPYSYPMRNRAHWGKSTEDETTWDSALRSTHDVTGYDIQASDGEIGEVEGFIIDPETWAIRYLLVDTGNWWPGKKVLVSPQWIDRVSWSDKKVFVSLSREQVKQSPEYQEVSGLNREYETGLYRHYKHPGYWVDDLAPRNTPAKPARP